MSLTVGTNTYCSLADAEAYFTLRLNSAAWQDASEPNKNAALASACRSMERLRFIGDPTVNTQALQWPRKGIRTPNNQAVVSSEYPAVLVSAQCEEALALLTLANDPSFAVRLAVQQQGVVKATNGQASEDYGERKTVAGLYSQEAYHLIAPLLRRDVSYVDLGFSRVPNVPNPGLRLA